MSRDERHRMKMLIKLAQRGASQKRLQRAARAHERIATTDATEEPERVPAPAGRAI